MLILSTSLARVMPMILQLTMLGASRTIVIGHLSAFFTDQKSLRWPVTFWRRRWRRDRIPLPLTHVLPLNRLLHLYQHHRPISRRRQIQRDLLWIICRLVRQTWDKLPMHYGSCSNSLARKTFKAPRPICPCFHVLFHQVSPIRLSGCSRLWVTLNRLYQAQASSPMSRIMLPSVEPLPHPMVVTRLYEHHTYRLTAHPAKTTSVHSVFVATFVYYA